jgi:hypothetical protein
MRKTMCSVIVLIAMTAVVGCRAKVDDAAIEKDIESTVAADPATQGSEVSVASKQGKVRLTGNVKDSTAQKRVTKIAQDEPGVSEVDNETIAAATPPPPPPEPVPSFSAAQKIGMFAYPKDQQSRDQQLRDELACYNSAEQSSGIDPDKLSKPTAPTAAQVQAAQQDAAQDATQAKGGRVRGAAKGAAGGAVVGAIAGDAGKGAAIGAVGGTMVGGTRQRRANTASKQQAANDASAQMQADHNQAVSTYNTQLDTFKRAFSACMEARNYSVK